VLALDDVAAYVLDCGLVKPEAIVDGGLTVTDLSRRNKVFLVTADVGRCFVLKVAAPEHGDAITREAAVLACLRDAASGRRLLAHIPRVAADDRANGVLVLETTRTAHDFMHHHKRHARGRFSVALARDVGRLLADLHGLPASLLDDLPGAEPRGWGSRLHRPALEAVSDAGFATLELLRLVQGFDALCSGLEALARQPFQLTPIHGDVRWANLVAPAGSGGRRDRAVLIDWELACAGDPCIDVGAFLADYLRAWVQSIPIVDPRAPGRLLDRARAPLSRMQPALRGFWDGYARGSGRAGPDLARFLRRCTSYAAVRLLEGAYEEVHDASTLRPTVLHELQLCANLLSRPDDAAGLLLGLDDPAATAA
jgi:aminoglycoside phosphotransferase (APT) family kinase protein